MIARKSVGARTFAFVHERDPDSDHFSVCVSPRGVSGGEESSNSIVKATSLSRCHVVAMVQKVALGHIEQLFSSTKKYDSVSIGLAGSFLTFREREAENF